jgi:molecular chaperone GrpE
MLDMFRASWEGGDFDDGAVTMQDANTPTPAERVALPIDGEHAVADTVADVPLDPAPDIAELLRKAETEAGELKEAWLRARAETDNVRKQAANDVAKAHKYAIERFAEELLPVRDALEQTLAQASDGATPEALVSGVELTLKQLAAAFDKAGLVVIDPDGQKFDPHRHQAMQMVDSSQPANTVVTVFQKGYLINDRVLRPALVTVSKGTDGPA